MDERARSRGRSRGPRPLGPSLERLRRRLAPPTLLAVAQERWAEAVGQRIAEQAAPVAERDGVLVVACHSSVWASELAMLSATLLEKLNRELGGDRRVLGLRFVIRPS